MEIIQIIMTILFVAFIGGGIIISVNPKLRDKLFGEHTELTAKRIKKGLMEAEKGSCKYCEASIDKDSKFCKSCGKKQ